MASATAAVALLLPFCQYLLHRVRTDHLEQLKRVVSEFLNNPRSFETVDAMIQLSFPIVTIAPFDNTNAHERERADAILSRMRQLAGNEPLVHGDDFEAVTTALATRVELKNWDWLRDIYFEFCRGDDQVLQEFITLQRQNISIIPVRPIEGIQLSTPGKRSSASGEDPPIPTPANCPPVPLSGEIDLFRDMSSATVSTRISRKQVLAKFGEIEAQRPWETIFDVTKIEYPFDAVKYPNLADALDKFWTRHARAVWERQFWLCFKSPSDHQRQQDERKFRQDAATRSFETCVMTPVYKVLEAEFFVDLDRGERHYWWWYRLPVIDILSMGHPECLRYLKAKAFERFPNPPAGFEMRRHNYNPDRSSMWAALAKYKKFKDEIEQLKENAKS